MGKLVRTYTEKLENVINRGVDLRHQMRVKIESKDAIIRTQAIRIQQLEEQIETLKDDKRAKKLESAKAERELEINTPKYKKLLQRYEDQEQFTQRLKSWVKERNGGVLPVELTK